MLVFVLALLLLVLCALLVSYVCFVLCFVMALVMMHIQLGFSFCIGYSSMHTCSRDPAGHLLLAASGFSQECLLRFFVLCVKVRVLVEQATFTYGDDMTKKPLMAIRENMVGAVVCIYMMAYYQGQEGEKKTFTRENGFARFIFLFHYRREQRLLLPPFGETLRLRCSNSSSSS